MSRVVGRCLAVAVAALLVSLCCAASAQSVTGSAPQDLRASDLGAGRVQFAWNPPARDAYGGVSPTQYSVEVLALYEGVGYGTLLCDESPRGSTLVTGTACTVTRFPYGRQVTITVRPWVPYLGDPLTGTFTVCCDVPGSPTAIIASAGNSSTEVVWGPPANAAAAGGVFTYTVSSVPGGVVCVTADLRCVAGGLTNGVAYTFSVTASNATGTGPPGTSRPVTPSGSPSPPSGVQAFMRGGVALVAWTGPSDTGGSPIERYVVTSTPSGLSCESYVRLRCTVEGLVSGQRYSFTVTAYNGAGQSSTSAPSARATYLGVPGAPTRVRAASTGGSATITWGRPRTNGGASITGYVVVSTPANRKCTTTGALSCRISGLPAGQRYSFTVQARSRAGSGLPGQSNAVLISRPASPTTGPATPPPTPKPEAEIS